MSLVIAFGVCLQVRRDLGLQSRHEQPARPLAGNLVEQDRKTSFTPTTRPRNGPFGVVDIARSRRSARPGSGMSERIGASASSRRARSGPVFN